MARLFDCSRDVNHQAIKQSSHLEIFKIHHSKLTRMNNLITGQYDYLPQKRVIYGKECGQAVAEEVKNYGAKNILLVAAKSLHTKLNATQSLIDQLGDKVIAIFDKVAAHAPLPNVWALTELMNEVQPDLIVSIGGGSVRDTAKVAALAYGAGVKSKDAISDLRVKVGDNGQMVIPELPQNIVRQISIPTTLSGAEFVTIAGAVDLDRNIKDIYRHPQMISELIIYDPALARLTPNDLWISTGMRAVDHAVETILSVAASPFTDGPALHALRLFNEGLEAGEQANISLEALQNCQFGVWLSTIGLGRTPYGASHGIGHQVGAIGKVPHGLCTCVLLPSVLKYNATAAGEKDRWIATALGHPEWTASDAVAHLIKRLGLVSNLKDAGVKREQLPLIAEASMTNYFVKNNLRPIKSPEQVMEILEMAFE